MNQSAKRNDYIPALLVFIGLPLLLYFLGDFPRRTVLKESFSILFILSFSLMLGQFFLARSYKSIRSYIKMITVLKIHKIIGYIFVGVLLVHPFLIVIPLYIESGVTPAEAFITIITTFESQGVVLGIISWCLLLILGITSLIRNKLPMKYKTWRVFHGIVSVLFISLSTWHAIDLGRHTDKPLSIYMIILATYGIFLLLKIYFIKPSKQNNGE